MEFRIGIYTGDVIVDGEQIYGDGVNVAARLEGLARRPRRHMCLGSRRPEAIVQAR
jgi:class 3 adenylate cyclase